MNENKSEVARLMQRIDEEYEAAERGLNGFAQVEQHEFITARMERIGEHYEDLQQLVGEQEACRLLVEASNKPREVGASDEVSV